MRRRVSQVQSGISLFIELSTDCHSKSFPDFVALILRKKYNSLRVFHEQLFRTNDRKIVLNLMRETVVVTETLFHNDK